MDHTIFGLIKKRGEIAGQHKVALKAVDDLKHDLDAIDRALVLCGYQDDPNPQFCHSFNVSSIGVLFGLVIGFPNAQF